MISSSSSSSVEPFDSVVVSTVQLIDVYISLSLLQLLQTVVAVTSDSDCPADLCRRCLLLKSPVHQAVSRAHQLT